MNFFIIIIFFLNFAANGQTVPSCQISFQFAKVCAFYNFSQKSCLPWDLTTCRKVKTTLHEHKCPIFTCTTPSAPTVPTTTAAKSIAPTTRLASTVPTTTAAKSIAPTKNSPNVKLLDQTSLPIGSVKTFMMTTTLSTASVQTGKQKYIPRPRKRTQILSTTRRTSTTTKEIPTTLRQTRSLTTRRRSVARQTCTTTKETPTTSTMRRSAPLRTSATTKETPTTSPVRRSTTPHMRTSTTTKETPTTSRQAPWQNRALTRTPWQNRLVTTTATPKFETILEQPQVQYSRKQQPSLPPFECAQPISTTTATSLAQKNQKLQLQDYRASVQSRKPRSEPVNCGDKECYLEYIFMSTCIIYLHSNKTDCDIPCKLDGCDQELHHYIDCPKWTCNAISTTTVSTTTTMTSVTTPTTTSIPSTTTITTMPNPTTTSSSSPATIKPFPFPTLDHPAYLYLSLACNILLTLGLLMVAYGKCKKRILRYVHTRRNRNGNQRNVEVGTGTGTGTGIPNANFVNPLAINPRTGRSYFSVSLSTDDENEPLLGASSYQPMLVNQSAHLQVPNPSESPRVPSFLNTPTQPFPNFPNSMTSLNPDYMLMKSFKHADAETQTVAEVETRL